MSGGSAGRAAPAWAIYEDMLRTRVFEERCVRAYQDGLVKGPVYPSGGQEAIGVGAGHALEEGDWVIPSLRTLGVVFARGMSTLDQFRTLLGSPKARHALRQPPHHSSSTEHRVVPGSTMLGGHLPVAAGLAFSAKLDKIASVAVAFMGDGSLGNGDVYETMNLAAVWELPLIIICENNGWQIMVPWQRARAYEETTRYAEAFGLATRQVEGNDAFDVYHSTRWARAQALSGRPAYLDCVTFRTAIYSTQFGEPRRKNPPDIESWKERDPLDRMARWLVANDAGTPERLEQLRERLQSEVEQALEMSLGELRAAGGEV